MRPPAIEKMGYYPTPTIILELLKTYAAAGDARGRLLDPCAGEGMAASGIGQAYNCETWGTELSPERATKAAQSMNRVYNAPWQVCQLNDEAVTVLFLNPPYETDRFDSRKRLEYDFLKSTTPKLVRGGLLIYIIPQKVLGLVEVARLLANYYECLTVGRFPDGEYETFKQVVVLGYRRKGYHAATDKEILAIQAMANEALPILEPLAEPVYRLLPAPERGANGKPVLFKRSDWEPEEIVEATRVNGVHRSKEWLDLLNPTRGKAELTRPVMPLKRGHIAMLMASGMMGTVRLTDEKGRPLLIKGRVVKVIEKVDEHDNGDGETVTEIYRDRFITTIAVLNKEGIQIIKDVKGLADFMRAHGDKIAAHVLETYRPLYNLDPTSVEVAVLDTLGKGRKALPGQSEPGLLSTQRHAAAAVARCIHKNGVANIQAEMGVGKASWNGAKVFTHNGYKLMGEIKVGDLVIGASGKPTEVIGVYPQGKKDIYRVDFTDGSSTQVTEDHLWEINSPLRKWKGKPARVVSTQDIMNQPLTHANGNKQFFVPMVKPVEFSPQQVLLDPYFLGLLIGDGSFVSGTPKISSADEEILETVRQLVKPLELNVKHVRNYDYGISGGKEHKTNGEFKGDTNAITCILKELGLWGKSSANKFVPDSYRYNSVQVRIEILRGLLDTDGYVNPRNQAVEYCTVSKKLAEDVKELVQSLGGTCSVREKPTKCQLAYRIRISLPGQFNPFRLKRKAEVYHPRTKYQPSRAITKIEWVGNDEATCIKVADPRELYATDEFILTHNTTIAAGAIDLLDAYPALILCPPHLVPKWIREIEDVIPEAQARELRRIGRSGDERADVNDVRSFLSDWRSGRLGKKAVAVMANTSAKIGSGWEPAVMKRKVRDPLTGQITIACVCPACGAPVYGEESGYVIDPEELAGKRRFCRASVPGWQLGADGRLKRDEQGNTTWGTRPCNTPLFRFSGARRWSLAEYIAKHAKGVFKLLCADESHEYKGKSSDRGIAFHQLITACQSTLTLTGTFFGGRSTSIFWLLHRLNTGVRRDFAFHDEKRWARLYGVLETQRRRRRNEEEDEDGVFTGNRRYRNQAKEQPGVSPAIVNRLLDTTVFLSLKDLGLALPEYKEEVSTLTMLDDQSQQYHQMDSSLRSMALQSNRYLSTWLQWSLARPNSAFRDETIIVDELNKKGEVIRHVPLMELPAINPNGHKWLPKEGWLANFCRAEKLQGRKVLVYVRQTGKRDIQDHLVLPLEENGLRVTVLGGNVDPRKREDWIAKRADRLDVLICNPELVKTGLDLVQFSSVVFFEITYSLYTLWQAVRRVWRLGQVRPVRAIFSVYNGTMEARALSLMGAKMKAAQLLYGDEVGGAIVPEEDGDLLTELAREVLNGADLPDLQTLFADEMKVSNNPLGSMTMPSAVILPGEKVMTWSDWMAEKVMVVRRKSRKEVVPEGQMGLGI